jgi:hypothetical protein
MGTRGLVRLLHVALEVQVRNQYWALKRWASKEPLRQELKKTASKSRVMCNMGVHRDMKDHDEVMYAMYSLTVQQRLVLLSFFMYLDDTWGETFEEERRRL